MNEKNRPSLWVRKSCSRKTVGVLGVKFFVFVVWILPQRLPQSKIAGPSELRFTSAATQRSFTEPNC